MSSTYTFTSESVTEGHPDKLCDRVSDAVLDEILEHDPEQGRVACECFASGEQFIVGGEISSSHDLELEELVRREILQVGYDRDELGTNANTFRVQNLLTEQSPDIAQGIENSVESRRDGGDPLDELGAGDQGMMFGYACRETEILHTAEPVLMPLPIFLAHRLTRRLTEVRRSGELGFLRPDGKSQVSVRYVDGEPSHVERLLISAQHNPDVDNGELRGALLDNVAQHAVPERLFPPGGFDEESFLSNPTGRFVKGGPGADSGLTGRKIIVDTYGGQARHGGGAFSGKDPTKVDRSAAYYARYAAKNLVAAGVAERLEVQVSYAIGKANPLSVFVEDFGTASVDKQEIQRLLEDSDLFDFRPLAIINELDLRKPRYKPLSAYGHVGREDLDLPWEKLDRVEAVREALDLQGVRAESVSS